jgi:hypothetical protein
MVSGRGCSALCALFVVLGGDPRCSAVNGSRGINAGCCVVGTGCVVNWEPEDKGRRVGYIIICLREIVSLVVRDLFLGS